MYQTKTPPSEGSWGLFPGGSRMVGPRTILSGGPKETQSDTGDTLFIVSHFLVYPGVQNRYLRRYKFFTSLTSTLSCLPRSRVYRTVEDTLDLYRKLYIALFSLIFILGIIGNGLVIWIAGFRMKKTISAVWFLSLAIADFLCCMSLPLQIAHWAYVITYPNISLCIFNAILFTINMCTSIITLTAMSIDRCVSVIWPLWARVHRTRRLVRITAGGVWGLSFVLTGLMMYLDVSYIGDVSSWCGAYTNSNFTTNLSVAVQMVKLVIMFVIPFLIIVTNYVIIFLTLRRSNRPQRSQRPYRIITAVILVFFICWSPFYIVPTVLIFLENLYDIRIIISIFVINILAYLNSCLNPIIYVFMGQNIKPYFFRSIPARVERALSDYPEEPDREPGDGENILNADV
ncbi:C3a anaphylatoxin chemotactic receptor-like [Leptodactylus fuscus]|uniref:C3a anaphylatoxin chemotactic receptor-like n=1 Tax=Leptodactylus fuscus TaxID=238119 RepID=UPI003F4E8D50